MTPPELRTDAWLLRGISGIPGELRLRAGTLSFTAHGAGSAWPRQLHKLAALLDRPPFNAALDAGTPVELFAWPVAEICVSQPWYYFGGGIKLRHRGAGLRMSFGRPVARHAPGRAFADLREVVTMRARGRLWAAALEASLR